MKIINKYILGAMAGCLFAFTSCSDDIVREPSPTVDPNCQGAYFVENNEYDYEFEPDAATQFTLMIGRTNTESAATVGIEVIVNSENVFQVPESVSFEAGQEEAPLTITFPNAEVGVTYNYELKFAEGAYNPYTEATTYVAGQVMRVKWDPIDTTIMIDGLVPTFFQAPYPVAHYVTGEHTVLPDGTERVRLLNPYAPATNIDSNGIYIGYPNNVDTDMTDREVVLTINISNTTATIGTTTLLGFNWGYGEFFCGTVYPGLSSDSSTYPPGVVTKDDEGNLVSIVFGASSMYVGMTEYEDGGAFVSSNPTCLFFSLEAYQEYMAELE